MPAPNTPNADLEQSLFKANLKETRLRHRAFLAFLLPALLGGGWLCYALVVVTHWEAESRAVAAKEAAIAGREAAAAQQVAEADARRATAESSVEGAQAKEKAAQERAADIEQRLVKVREEIGALGPLLSEIASAKEKASKLGASEPVEKQLTAIRTRLGSTLGRIEQEIDKGLPTAAQKPRVFLFIADDAQRKAATELVTVLEDAGYDVAPVAKSPTRRSESTEIRYFREPGDKAEAARLQELVEKQTGQTDTKVARIADPDQASGSRKFQVWLGKPPPVAGR